MEIRIKGVPALVLILAIGAFYVWRTTAARADLEQGAAQELRIWLRAEYARQYLSRAEEGQPLPPALTDSILAAQNITFPSIKARGTHNDMVVRAEFLLDGKPPPDGKNVRYYRMTYSMVTGWIMKAETYAFSYYLALF